MMASIRRPTPISETSMTRPGRRERVDHDEGENGEQDHHDREHGNERRRTSYGSDLFPRHLAQGLAVPSHREEERGHVLHGAGQYDADDDPDRPWQVAHLRGQNGSD